MKSRIESKVKQTKKLTGIVPEDKTGLSYKLRQIIFQSVKEVLGEKNQDLQFSDILVEHPADENYGDYSTNIAMILAGKIGRSPKEIAEAVKKNLEDMNLDFVEKIEIAGSGFINISLSKKYLIAQAQKVLEKADDYGKNLAVKGKRIIVEFAHPNTHKGFHIGHLRNITIGESLVRLLETIGAKVIRANYQGDVGMHIAKCLYSILQTQSYERVKSKSLKEKVEFLSKAYVVGSKAYEEDEKSKETIKDINYLIYACAQKSQEEQGVAPGSTDYMQFVKGKTIELDRVYKLWKMTRQWSLDYFEEIYKRVYSHYDRYYFESECLKGVDIAKDAVEKSILEKSKGAIIFNGEPYGLDKRVFVNSLGLPTYEAKELALAQMQFSEFGKIDKNIHVVAPEQTSFFKVTFKVEELLDPDKYKDRQYHLIYGWVRLKHGKMSSREGKVILGEWLLDEAKKKIKKIMDQTKTLRHSDSGQVEKISEKAAVGAVKYSLLKINPRMDIAFDLEESISFEGSSGPYLQYTYARCRSVLRKATRHLGGVPTNVEDSCEVEETRPNPEELSLLRTFYRFPEVVLKAAGDFSPNTICAFLYDLSQKYNTFYNKCSILKSEEKKRDLRLLLTSACAQILKNGLYLLGIGVLEKM